MLNQELATAIAELIETLEGIEEALADLSDLREAARERELERRQRAVAPGANENWPWTPETSVQGFLAGRWLRRDGNVYGPAATLLGAPQAPNAPLAGGDDNQAKVYVPSGVPRVGPYS